MCTYVYANSVCVLKCISYKIELENTFDCVV